MKQRNLRDWRILSEMRNQLNEVENAMAAMAEENEELREGLAEPIREELLEEYEERLMAERREARKWREMYEEISAECEDLRETVNEMQKEKEAVQMWMRKAMGCEVNVNGNYIERCSVNNGRGR